ncbi:RHS repeat-associated core domain-containing protein [Xenorhabdus bovienii]|uniref:RHS repeat-associated core domain-containing protein n=1 Tax=Xenorhabdus bovienii TaxID=40576 RepID=UPI00237CBAFE|nr:RHS repeat-associated core domain-containing protein [Xenorhabdus bovienii]MDE1491704.1 RHS repeat protein [Xenorhabdus bovienii]
MINKNFQVHHKTPVVTVQDNRMLTVRDIHYHCHPDQPDHIDDRITRYRFNAHGRLSTSIDPRLAELQQSNQAINPNFTYLSSLTGDVLRTDSVDAGTAITLNDIEGRPIFSVNATSVTRRWQYEKPSYIGRLLSITEQQQGQAVQVTERFVWAGNSPSEKAFNLTGQCVRHYDTAGMLQTNSIALTGIPLSTARQLLPEGSVVDWRGDSEPDWKDQLVPEAFTTTCTTNAAGTVLTQTDTKGNRQRLAYDVAGLLCGSWLTIKGASEQVIIKSLTYSAAGHKLREEHGNGIVTTYLYEPKTLRLVGIKTERPEKYAAGVKVLQDLRYEYDPVGNVVSLCNDAEATRFWRNQKVDAKAIYVYDSLYQLVSASGREMANIGQQTNQLPTPIIPLNTDSSTYTNYTRTYTYDRGNNLTQIRHSAPATGNNYTIAITVSERNNHAVLSTLTDIPSKVDTFFDKAGSQLQLMPGQRLDWTMRGALQQVTRVNRLSGQPDRESYLYDGNNHRVVKISTQQTGGSQQQQRVLYLPELELRTTKNSDVEKEILQIIKIGEAGRAQVRVLHWESGKPDALSNNQIRYSYDNLVGSSGLEVDGDGQIISLEEYYPYGGTAVWTARSQTEADYKTIRYSGKERDATGLYYYGYRYYQPWTARWLSADPAGTVDGLNLFRMVRNNPITLFDPTGNLPMNHNELPADTNLSQIAMLGSHDAGTYAYSRAKSGFSMSLGALLPRAFKTQNLTLKEQAEAGVRYFDIRVAQRKDGSFGFFHGPSVAGGDATADVKALLEHAGKDTNNFYLFKMVFKGEGKKKATSRTSASDTFLQDVLAAHRNNLITRDDTSSLGEATVDLLSKGKNIGLMVHGYDGTEPHWSYKEQVHTQWANRASATETAEFLSEYHATPAPDGQLNVIQTNIPFASPGRGQFTLGVKNYLSRIKGILADAVDKIPHAGIISADYIGSEHGASSRFMERIELHNQSLMNTRLL